MPLNKQAGDYGEQEIVDLIRCPNCSKKLMLLPPNFPIYDVTLIHPGGVTTCSNSLNQLIL